MLRALALPLVLLAGLAGLAAPAAAQDALPDLAIFSYVIEPRADGTAFVSLTVRNEGDAPAPAYVVRFYLDFEKERDVAMEPLDHGFVKTTTFTLTGLTPGDHLLHAEIDPEGQVVQHHRVAHDQPKSFTVPAPSTSSPTPTRTPSTSPTPPTQPPATPKADLYVGRLSTSPAPANAGDRVSFQLEVANGGGAAASAPTATLWTSLDGTERPFALPTTIAAGGRASASLELLFPDAGDFTYRVRLDPGGTIAESNEQNNEATGTIRIAGPLPDLVVESVAVEPAAPKVGDLVTVKATIRNVGTAATTAIQANVTATTGGTRPLVGVFVLKPGESGIASYTYPWLAPGAQTFLVRAEALGATNDPTPANNRGTATATVTGSGTYLPDWVVVSIEEKDATLLVNVENVGNGASESVLMDLTLEGRALTLSSVSRNGTGYTEPGIMRQVLFEKPADYAKGQRLAATVDPANTARESNEANNAFETSSAAKTPAPALVLVLTTLAVLAAAWPTRGGRR